MSGDLNFQTIETFSQSTGGICYAGVIEGSDGNLYGRTSFYGTNDSGTAFKMGTNGSNYQALYSFSANAVGSPANIGNIGGVFEASSGLLYAPDPNGGVAGAGVLLNIATNGTGATTVYDFSTDFAATTPTALCAGLDGRLYGTTASPGYGTVFGVNKDGTGMVTLHFFDNAGTDGRAPVGLIAGADGRLYGITTAGGTGSGGTIFGLSADGSGYATIYDFTSGGATGQEPCGITQGSDGYLYVATTAGGSAGFGTVCKVAVNGTGFAVIHTFVLTGSDGKSPNGGVIQASNGMLYGVTPSGGSAGDGVVYGLNTDGTGYVILYNFNSSTGSGNGSMLQGSDGALYGGTFNTFSSVFRLLTNGSSFSIIYNFQTGSYSPINLCRGSDGGLYGTVGVTQGRDFASTGEMFRIALNGAGFLELTTLSSPCVNGSIVAAPNGIFYGVTNGSVAEAGTTYGVLFEVVFTPTAPTITAQPQGQTVPAGQSASISVTAIGIPPPSYQWLEGGTAILGATSATYTIASVQPSNAGAYSCSVSNEAGTITSVQVTLAVGSAVPLITTQPLTQAVNAGSTLTLSTVASGATGYQWEINGTSIVGATVSSLTLANTGTTQAGSYTVVVSNATGSVTSSPATLTVNVSAYPVNISSRAEVGAGSEVLIAGFVIDGTTSETVLIRAVGPTLSQFGVVGTLTTTELDLYDVNDALIATNIGWGNASVTGSSTVAAGIQPATSAVFSETGAFALPNGSADSAMVVTLPPGEYTAQIKGVNGTVGVALVEIYNVP